jgi:hypothetical protein
VVTLAPSSKFFAAADIITAAACQRYRLRISALRALIFSLLRSVSYSIRGVGGDIQGFTVPRATL